ncbi:hypothetical protein PV325_000180, partial [Microctonus aethiopoides]
MAGQQTQHVHTNNNQGHPDLPPRQIYQHPNIDNINSVRDDAPLTIMTDSLQQYNNRHLYDLTPSPSIINTHINHDQQTPENLRTFHNLQTRKRIESENGAITREEFGKILQELGYLRKTMEKMAETMESMERKFNSHWTEDDNIFEPPQGFPMKTLDDFETFESGDPHIHDALKAHLIFIGGQTLREALNS